MKLHYYEETDSLYIDLADRVSSDSRELSDGFVVDYDSSGNVVGIDIQQASARLDLSRIETSHLPLGAARWRRSLARDVLKRFLQATAIVSLSRPSFWRLPKVFDNRLCRVTCCGIPR